MVRLNSSPVLSIYLVPAACVAALMGLYKPKSNKKRALRTTILVIAGVFIAVSVVQSHLFAQGQVDAIKGAGIGYGIGLYAAISSCALILVSSVFATKENDKDSAVTPGSVSEKVSMSLSRGGKFIAQAFWRTRGMMAQSFKAASRNSFGKENSAGAIEKVRRTYVKERSRQQELLKGELGNLDKFLKSRSIDEETGSRLRRVLKMSYEKQRDETRKTFGFTDNTKVSSEGKSP